MGCGNALLIRYKVRIKDESSGLGGQPFDPMGLITIKQISRVTGLGLGDEGTITLTEYNKIVTIPDGRRKLPNLGLQMRMDGSVAAIFHLTFFEDWWEERQSKTYTIAVDITKRDWTPILTLEYQGSSILSHNYEDQDLGAPRLGFVNMTFAPYDVVLNRTAESLKF